MNSNSLRGLVNQMRAGTITSSELVSSCLARIGQHNSELNAFCYINDQGALTAAKRCDQLARSGKSLGRLHGIPFSVKDHINVAGLPRSEGTRLHAISAAPTSARTVELLEAEGAICIGKSNMAEYGKSYYTENAAFGRSSNPFNLEYTCGGSGGADAAIVAQQMACFGLGADAGGSLRVPANFCGQFAIHPTHGTITSAGLLHPSSTIASMIRAFGPISHSLEDLELLWRILSQYDPNDSHSVAFPNLQTSSTRKFLFFDSLNGFECEPEIQSALKACVKRLESLGFQAYEGAPASFAAAIEIFILIAGQAALINEDIAAANRQQPRDPLQESDLMRDLRARLAARLEPLSLERFFTIWQRCDQLRDEANKVFNEFDFVISPVAARRAMQHGTTRYQVGDREYESHQVFQFSSCINLLNLPAIAFPTGLGGDGLPLGLQIIGRRFSESTLFGILRQANYTDGLVPAQRPS